MKSWFASLNGAITFSVIALFTELWRAVTRHIAVHSLVRWLDLGTAACDARESQCNDRGAHHQSAVSACHPYWHAGRLLPFVVLRDLAPDGTGKLDQPALWAAGYCCAGVSTSPIQGNEPITACTQRVGKSPHA